LSVFEACDAISAVVLVTSAALRHSLETLLREVPGAKVACLVEGGATRQESVWKGLNALPPPLGAEDLVAIHDGARPFLSRQLLEACLKQARRTGAALAAAPVSDTVKRVQEGLVEHTLPREHLWLAQTPQVFRRDLILEAHRRAQQDGFVGTDDASLVERLGHRVAVVPSSAANLKVTTPLDLALARLIAEHPQALPADIEGTAQ